MKNLIQYLKSLIQSNTGNSMKSFTSLLSVLAGITMATCVSFALLWDVISNGHLCTNLEELGWFILCIGGFMAGGGLNKIISDSRRNDNKNEIQDK